ncbi:MAG TPA: glycosyltransferase family A protein [Gammaproteobacteria bacterium]
MSEVDVLIPTCDRGAALAVTLASLCAQTFAAFAVIVSDQSHAAGAERWGEVRAAIRVLESHGNPVRLVEHLPRRGIAEQRQFLLEQSAAPLVLCLDDDVILEPWVLELLVQTLRSEGCGFVGSAAIGLSYLDDVRPHEQHVDPWQGPVEPEEVRPGTPAWERFKLHNAANLCHVQRRLGATPDAPVRYKVAWCGACALYDAAKLRSVGGFSFWQDLPAEHCGEDVLAQLRVMRAYGGCGVMPSGVYHQELPTTIPQRRVSAERALGWGTVRPPRGG